MKNKVQSSKWLGAALAAVLAAGGCSRAKTDPAGFWVQHDDPARDNVIVFIGREPLPCWGHIVFVRYSGEPAGLDLKWTADGEGLVGVCPHEGTTVARIEVAGGRLSGTVSPPESRSHDVGGEARLNGLTKASADTLRRLTAAYVRAERGRPAWRAEQISGYMPAEYVEAAIQELERETQAKTQP